MLRVGELIDLDETAQQLVAAGYQRVDQVEDRGQFAIRGGLLDVYPATEERAVRVDMFDIEIEALRWFSHLHPAQPGGDRVRRDLARRRARARAPRAGRDRRRPTRIARTSPSCCRSSTSATLLELIPEHTQVIVAAEEDVEPTLRDHWEDVCTAFDDQDARDLYVNPTKINAALAERAEARLSSISGNQSIQIRGQAADFAARNLHEAESELEKLVRCDYTTVVAWPQLGAAERAAYNLDRIKASLNGAHARAGLHRGQPARRLRRARPEARRLPRAPADPPQEGVDAPDAQGPRPAALVHRPAHGRPHRPRGPRHRALRRLRHQDRRRRHPRLPEPRVPGRRQGLHAGRPAGEDLAATWAPTAARRRCPSSAARAGTRSRRAPAAPRRSSRASC